jgi:integrase
MFYFTKEELTKLIEVATAANPIHGLFFQTAYTHGMRVSECLKLTPRNIKGGNLVQTRSKHGKRTSFPASAELQAYAKTLGPEEFLFRFYRNSSHTVNRVAADKHIKRYCKMAGIEPRSMHKLRFALVRHSREAGVPHAAITVHCGWRSHATVHHYDRVSQAESQQAMAAVVGG